MGWLENFRRRRAAKAYVFKLGPWLRRGYGTSRTYTAPQIERGVRELNLDPRHILFGHAVFLDSATFEGICGILPNPMTIEEARAALRRELGAPSQFDPGYENIDEAGAWAWNFR
jgi:uncharacterized protein DUF6559